MSEDRFKQARRSLIDRNQRQQSGGGGGDGEFDEEATAVVDLAALQQGQPQPQQRPGVESQQRPRAPQQPRGPYNDDATEMLQRPPYLGAAGPSGGGGSQSPRSSQPGGWQDDYPGEEATIEINPRTLGFGEALGGGGVGSHDRGSDDFEEKTSLMSLEALRGIVPGVQSGSQGGYGSGHDSGSYGGQGGQGGYGGGHDSGSYGGYGGQDGYRGGHDSGSYGGYGGQGGYGGGHDSGNYGGGQPSFDSGPTGGMQIGTLPPSSEERTEYVNLNDLPRGGGGGAVPGGGFHGGGGEATEYVNLSELMTGDDPPMGGPAVASLPTGPVSIEHDEILRRSYQFVSQDIHQGPITLIFARNALGRDVVLRRVWEGSLREMPKSLRTFASLYMELAKGVKLVAMEGLFVAQTGIWAELGRPQGMRLTQYLHSAGPQTMEQARMWGPQIAAILKHLHAHDLVYQNLSTGAVWIQEDQSVVLEPFGPLSFEERGDLGAFGPVEMRQATAQRVVGPGTDVYSFAAVMVAILTGLPLDLSRVDSLDKPVATALRKALVQNPHQRLSKVGEAAQPFEGSGKLELPSIKILGPVVVLIALGIIGAFFWNEKQVGEAIAYNQAIRQRIEQREAERQDRLQAGLEKAAVALEPSTLDCKAVAAPLEEADERLAVSVSCQTNPPQEAAARAVALDPAKAVELRRKAEKKAQQAKKLRGKDRFEFRRIALESLAQAARLDEGQPSEEDRELRRDLLLQDDIQEYRKRIFKELDKELRSGQLSEARRSYQKLHVIEAEAAHLDFFNRHNRAKVTLVGAPGADDGEAAGDE